MMSRERRMFLIVCVVLAVARAATPVAGQLPNPSAAALGLAENQTALIRGFAAVSLNPAGLAMPEGPPASGVFVALRGVGGLGPVGLGDLADYDGEPVPEEVRQRWLDRIERADGEQGSAGADLTYIAAQFGRVGFQLSSTADMVANIGPGAAELLLFGNAGRTGQPVDISLEGSSFDLVLSSTAGIGYGHPLISGAGRFLGVGGTLTYTVGHAMMTALELGGGASADPLEIGVEFPIVQTDSTLGLGGGDRGRGIGLDLGAAWREGRFMAGLTVRNLFNTFAWDEDDLRYRPGSVSVTEDSRATDFDLQPFSAAPAPVRARVRELGYSPIVAAGVAYEILEDLRLSADFRQRLGDGQPFGPATQIGTGAEYRPLEWLPLRAGGAVIPDGFLLSAGLGIDLSPVRLDAAAARRRTDLGTASIAMFSFSLVAR